MSVSPSAAAKRPRRLLRWLLAAAFMLPAWANAGVGVAAIEVTDPVGGGAMPGFVFYPAATSTSPAKIGPYEVAAAFDAPAQPGARPLVVISHGHGGSNLGHHDLATYLAGHGFVVATFEHPKDNFRDTSGNGKAEVMAGRALQVAATTSALLDAPDWKALIDADRIGVAGFSAGGYTSLLVVGAAPRFDRFIGYCERHPDDGDICGQVRQLGDGVVDALASLQADFARLGPVADPRVKAAFVMAPQAIPFDEAGLAGIDRPVFLYYGERDRVLRPDENALRIAPLLRTLDRSVAVPDADHWVFLAPCSEALAREAVEICSDPAGVDRAQVHEQVNADALAFFRKALGVSVE
ncbi:alpha/beta hydrolase family protein [Luteimonas lutimaris]|uniref:Dienelactone hydrolase n=1 Tax=Luteimonas lutimaris TaxID=698645 RepID=A0ABP7M3Z3_9GAMM